MPCQCTSSVIPDSTGIVLRNPIPVKTESFESILIQFSASLNIENERQIGLSKTANKVRQGLSVKYVANSS